MRKMILFLAILAALTVLTGCETILTATPKSADRSVLYIMRKDAIASMKDQAEFYLNGVKITDLEAEEFKALHLTPGNYEFEYRVTDSNGKKIVVAKFEGTIKPDTVNITTIRFILGWSSLRKLSDARNLAVGARQKDGGEMDVTGMVKPR